MRLHTVRFATSSSRFMMTIFDQFIDQYPDNNFNIDIISNSEMIQKLLFQNIHFTLNTMALTHPHIHCKQIITEDIVLTYPKYLDGQHIDLRDPDLYKSFYFLLKIRNLIVCLKKSCPINIYPSIMKTM